MVKQEFKADVSDAERNLEKLRKDMIKLQEEINKTAQISNDAEKKHQQEVQKGLRLQQQLIAQTETLAQKKQRMQESIKTAYEAGRMSADDYQQALDNIEKATYEVTEAEKRHQEEVRKGVLLHQRYSAQTETLAEKKQRLQKQLEAAWSTGAITSRQYAFGLQKIDEELDDVDQGAKRVDKSTSEVFGDTGLSTLAAYATVAGTIGAAWETAKNQLIDYQQQREKGREETLSLQDARSRLLQVSDGDYERLVSEADEAAIKFGVSREEAAQIKFRSISEGFQNEYEDVMSLDPLMKLDSAATIVGKSRNLYKAEGLTSTQAVSGVLQAARGSDAAIEDLANALPIIGEAGVAQGASYAESLATASVLSPEFSTTDTAAQRIKAITSKFSLDDRFKGMGILDAQQKLESLPEEEIDQFLGDGVEVNAAFHALKRNMIAIREEEARINNAMSRNLAGQRLQEYYAIDSNVALRDSISSEIQKDVNLEKQYSAEESKRVAYNAFLKNAQTEGRAGYTGLQGLYLRSMSSVNAMLGMDVEDDWYKNNDGSEVFVARDFREDQERRRAARMGGMASPQNDGETNQLLKEQNRLIEEQNGLLRKQGGGNPRAQGRSQEGLGGVDR